MKKLFLTLIVLGSQLLAGNGDASAPKADHTGIYMGAHFGNALATETTAQTFREHDNTPLSTTINGSGHFLGLHAGYGKQFDNNLYLGIEGWHNMFANNGNKDNDSIRYKIERHYSSGLAVRPGLVIGDILLYGKLGVDFVQFMNAIKISNMYFRNSVNSGAKKNSTSCIGVLSGLGIEILLSDNIKVGIEGNHIAYNGVEARDAYDRKHRLKTKASDVIMRLSYKW